VDQSLVSMPATELWLCLANHLPSRFKTTGAQEIDLTIGDMPRPWGICLDCTLCASVYGPCRHLGQSRAPLLCGSALCACWHVESPMLRVLLVICCQHAAFIEEGGGFM
jgi:hypothetical protein